MLFVAASRIGYADGKEAGHLLGNLQGEVRPEGIFIGGVQAAHRQRLVDTDRPQLAAQPFGHVRRFIQVVRERLRAREMRIFYVDVGIDHRSS